MSSYGQFCGVARALDLIGDRWNLLIVRELLVEPRRFTELRTGLPGIASNLLSSRLGQLQSAGVIERRLAERGVRYALTDWGGGLRGVIGELLRWSVPVMATGPRQGDAFQPQWIVVALDAFLDGVRPGAPLRIALQSPSSRIVAFLGPEGVDLAIDADAETDAAITAPGPLILALASGVLTLDDIIVRGAIVDGDRAQLELVFRARAEAAAQAQHEPGRPRTHDEPDSG